MREWGWVLAAVLGSLGLSGRAAAEVVELERLERQALEQQSVRQQAALRERAAAAELREAESAYMPRVGLNVESSIAPGRTLLALPGTDGFYVQGVNVLPRDGERDKDSDTPSPLLPQWRSGADLTVGANLYDFGRTAAAVAARRAKLDAVRTGRDLTKREIVAGVRAAYLAWLSAHELHRLSAHAQLDASRRSERVQALIAEGARPRGDLAPVEADRLLGELELGRALAQLETARLLLEESVGRPLPADAEPDRRLLEREPAAQSSTANPALAMLRREQAALSATARAQRRQRAPTLSVTAALGFRVQYGNVGRPSSDGVEGSDAMEDGTATERSGTTREWSRLPSYAVGLALAVPLWDGGGALAAAAATEARAEELSLELERVEAQQTLATRRAELDAQHATKRHETARQLLEVCRTRLTDVEAGYAMGAMQFEQVQQARTLLRRAETEAVLAQVARADAVLRLRP